MHVKDLRTWIEVDREAALYNVDTFRSLISENTKLMAVVKSNAYGHGILDFPHIVASSIDWFGVDSIVEGMRLRKDGIERPILVLGATLHSRLEDARDNDITVTISNFETLRRVLEMQDPPSFHLKLDTGMHRQGFVVDGGSVAGKGEDDLPKLIERLKKSKKTDRLTGAYTHFARAKGGEKDEFTRSQIQKYKDSTRALEAEGIALPIKHIAATSGVLFSKDAHMDMVRVGIGLYGMWPSPELRRVHSKMELRPVLSWKTVITEIKTVEEGESIGYDLTETLEKDSRLAVLPIGYWHGLDRGLSKIGHVLVRGRMCKIVGRISMDMVMIDVSGVKEVGSGDEVVIIGKSGNESIAAQDIAEQLNTINYEITTRTNPLIKRIVV